VLSGGREGEEVIDACSRGTAHPNNTATTTATTTTAATTTATTTQPSP
jgi:hypothetical protein